MSRLRFSIRDLFWLILVVAVGMAWLAREQHFRSESAVIERVAKEHDKWMGQIGALLYYIETVNGCPVASNWDGSELTIYAPNGRITYHVFDFDESSLNDSK